MTIVPIFDTPNYRKQDPDSSAEAGDENTNSGNRQNQSETVLEAVQKSPRSTARELSTRHGIDRYTVSRRLADLCNAGLIRKAPSRTCDIGKRKSCTWVEVDASQMVMF